MIFDHKQKEQVRSYLLGTMSGPEAQAFEESYFKDQAFFLWVQAVEVCLIEDYLNGKLPTEKIQSFESRYLNVVPLREKFEEVRDRQLRRAKAQRRSRVLRWAPLGALVLLCFGGFFYWYKHPKTVPAEQVAQNAPPPIHVRLVPGVQQGPNSMMTEVQLPVKNTAIEFDLEVPGRTASFLASVAVSEIDADGTFHRIWNSPSPVRSSPKGSAQEIAFQMDSSLLHHGDYRIDLTISDGTSSSAYILRAIPASPQIRRPEHE